MKHDIPIWIDDEVSTRNCYHCKVKIMSSEDRAFCEQGLALNSNPTVKFGETVSLSSVLRSKVLLRACRGCLELDNDWGIVPA